MKMKDIEIERFYDSVPEQAWQHARNAVRLNFASRHHYAALVMMDTYRDQIVGNIEICPYRDIGRLTFEVFQGNEGFIISNDLELRVLALSEPRLHYTDQLQRLDQALQGPRERNPRERGL